MRNPIFQAIFAALAVLLSSFSVVAAAQQNTAQSAAAVSVYTDTVRFVAVPQTLSLIGKLQSIQFVSIASEVAGKVEKIHVQASQKVTAGQLLVDLDDGKVQAALLEAQAYLADATRNLKEYAALVKKDAITQTQFDAQSAAVTIARARLLAADAALKQHHLRAPFSGTVGLIDFSPGMIVSSGSELLTLDDLSAMRLDLQVPERYLAQLSVGMPVTAKSNAWPDMVFSGKVSAIASRINPETLNLRVRIKFANLHQHLKPGMLLSATMVFPALNQPVIAVQALEYSGSKRFVYLVNKDSVAERTEVILGARIGDQVVIRKGLNIGDKIVVQGLVNMRDALKVRDLSATPVNSGERN